MAIRGANGAAVALDDGARNRQAQARVLAPAAIVWTVSEEAIEDTLDMRRREAGTAVLDPHDARRIVGTPSSLQRAIRRREARRIVEQVLEHLRQAIGRCRERSSASADARYAKRDAGIALLEPATRASRSADRSTVAISSCASCASIRASSRTPDTSRSSRSTSRVSIPRRRCRSAGSSVEAITSAATRIEASGFLNSCETSPANDSSSLMWASSRRRQLLERAREVADLVLAIDAAEAGWRRAAVRRAPARRGAAARAAGQSSPTSAAR